MNDTSPHLAAFAAQLKQARETSGRSQRQLAKACSLHQPQIARAEAGHDLQLSTVLAMAAELGYDLVLKPRQAASNAQNASEETLPADLGLADRIDARLAAYQREWPNINPLAIALLVRIQRAAQFINRATEEVAAAHGINGGELMVLGALRRAGPPYESTATDLRHLFFISLPGISKRLDRLSERGLIERRPNPQDGRGAVIKLLPAGHALLDHAVAVGRAREFNILSSLPDASARALSSLLQDLLRRFESQD